MFGAERGASAGGRSGRPVVDDDDPATGDGSPPSDGTVDTVMAVAPGAKSKGKRRANGSKSAIARRLSAHSSAKRQRKQSGFVAGSSGV